MRVLFLVPDAFGGIGGIAQFDRDFATAVAAQPTVERLTILPRAAPLTLGPLPAGIIQERPVTSKIGYTLTAGRLARRGADLIVCGHVNLLPAAVLARSLASRGCRLALVLHGVDAWQPVAVPRLGSVDLVIAVSDHTAARFRAWSRFPEERCVVLPNTVDTGRFEPGPPSPELVARYGLENAGPVVMALARLDSRDRDKGLDELLAVLPRLRERHPDLRCIIGGDGDDRDRLIAVARHLGLADRVVFPGYLREEEKADHYRLADAFVLCGRQEGFGIVLLEAMACGVPVVASTRDGSREAVGGGSLGLLADPDAPDALVAAIERAFGLRRPHVPDALEDTFGHAAFARRVGEIVRGLA